jgi:hypothetical protein
LTQDAFSNFDRSLMPLADDNDRCFVSDTAIGITEHSDSFSDSFKVGLHHHVSGGMAEFLVDAFKAVQVCADDGHWHIGRSL